MLLVDVYYNIGKGNRISFALQCSFFPSSLSNWTFTQAEAVIGCCFALAEL